VVRTDPMATGSQRFGRDNTRAGVGVEYDATGGV
jgi:hypothetical protein